MTGRQERVGRSIPFLIESRHECDAWVCKKESELQPILDSDAGQDRYLLLGFVHAAAAAGFVPKGDEVLDFKVAPIIGARMDISNIGAMDFVVRLNVAGQIHGQVRQMKRGTKISGISIS